MKFNVVALIEKIFSPLSWSESSIVSDRIAKNIAWKLDKSMHDFEQYKTMLFVNFRSYNWQNIESSIKFYSWEFSKIEWVPEDFRYEDWIVLNKEMADELLMLLLAKMLFPFVENIVRDMDTKHLILLEWNHVVQLIMSNSSLLDRLPEAINICFERCKSNFNNDDTIILNFNEVEILNLIKEKLWLSEEMFWKEIKIDIW